MRSLVTQARWINLGMVDAFNALAPAIQHLLIVTILNDAVQGGADRFS